MDNVDFLQGVAKQGAQSIDLTSGFRGAAEGVQLAMAEQKAQQIKMQMDEAKLKENQMKTSITLDYLKTMSNANSKVRPILSKQFGDFYKQAYGAELNQDTLKYIMESPDSTQILQQLADAGVLTGFGKKYVEGVNIMARGLELPVLDAKAEFEKGIELMAAERKAEASQELAQQRASIYAQNVSTDNAVALAKFEQDVEKDLENKREKLGFISNAFNLASQKDRVKSMKPEQLRVFDDQLVTAYTKMQDPTSVVMPSEVARTLSTMPIFDNLQAAAKKHLNEGGLLDPRQRQEMLKYVDAFQKEQTQRFNGYVGSVSNRVSKLGGNAETFSNYKFDPKTYKSTLGQEEPQVSTQGRKAVSTRDMISGGKSLEEVNNFRRSAGLSEISQAQYDIVKGGK